MLSIESQIIPQLSAGLVASDTTRATYGYRYQPEHRPATNSRPRWQSPLPPVPASTNRSASGSELPQISIASIISPDAHHYIDQCALISAHANLTSPLQRLLQIEKPTNALVSHPPPSATTLLPVMYTANKERLQGKVNSGSLIVEAGSFAATACWTPATSAPSPPPQSFLEDLMEQGQCCLAEFLSKMEAAKEKHLYPRSIQYWHLTMMARDPRREHISGAVRAIIEPFLAMAEIEGVPVWLEAGSEKARDVYRHFGFVEKEVVVVAGVKMWCMIRDC